MLASSQDTETTKGSFSSAHSSIYNDSSAHARHQMNNNLTLWHMNMNDALCGFEDLLNLTGHANDKVLDELLPSTVQDDSLMTIFSLISNKSDQPTAAGAAAPGRGAPAADSSPNSTAAAAPPLVKTNSLGISTDGLDGWGCCELDSAFTPVDHFADGDRGALGAGAFPWDDDSSVILIPTTEPPHVGLIRSRSDEFNERDAEELLKIL